jgi:hypothetical protein
LEETGKKPTKAPSGIIIIQATEEGMDVKVAEHLSYEDAQYLLIEALHVVRLYEESSCIPDNVVLQ